MKLRIILCILFLLSSCQFWVGIDGGKNQKKKSPKQKEILKEITTDLEICIQSDKNVDKKERMFVEFSNCLNNIKKPNLLKQFFGKKDKSAEEILKKVFKKMIKCLKKTHKKVTKKIIKVTKRRTKMIKKVIV